MKRHPFLCLLLALPLTLQAGAPGAPAPETAKAPQLKVGDLAPPFKVGRWLKGTPVTSLEKGRIYVLEAWATWCGPCKEAIPHLTELAKRYEGKVTFVSVNVWERGSSPEVIDKAVDTFMAETGAMMGYNVCRDTPDARFTNDWLKAANIPGIPNALVVDATGCVAWIGSPMKLDAVLDRISKGTFDGRADAARELAHTKAMEEIDKCVVEGRWLDALAKIEAFQLSEPTQSERLNLELFKLAAYLHVAPKKAEDQYAKLISDPQMLIHVSHLLIIQKNLDQVWYQRAIEGWTVFAGRRARYHYFLAIACSLAGDPQGAVTAQQAYLDWLKSEREQQLKAYPESRAQIEAGLTAAEVDLRKFQDALKAKP